MTDHKSTIATQEILDELDHAIGDHMTWLKEWHATLLCGEAPSAKALADDPHHLCRFGAWYVRNQHTGLVDQPALRNLASLHRKMHDDARTLMEKALDGRPPDRVRYGVFRTRPAPSSPRRGAWRRRSPPPRRTSTRSPGSTTARP